jgi:hypothetical protein
VALDIGIGVGELAAGMAEAVPTLRVVGIDVSHDVLAAARSPSPAGSACATGMPASRRCTASRSACWPPYSSQAAATPEGVADSELSAA